MIRMEGPSFCFNSYDIGLPHYRMWKSIVGPDAMTPSQLAMEIFRANLWSLQTFKSSFQNIILNTHGFDGGLWIGGIWDWDQVQESYAYERSGSIRYAQALQCRHNLDCFV